jgi:hypothetical protein
LIFEPPQERGLPHSRLACEQHETAARTAGHCAEEITEGRELTRPLEQFAALI